MTAPSPDEAFVKELKSFFPVFAPKQDGFVTELRALGIPGWKNSKPTDDCGFFDLSDPDGRKAMFEVIKGYVTRTEAEQPEGIYAIINPIDPEFLARANNRMGKKGQKISAEDKYVLSRRWLVVDVDPHRRISKVSATEDEKAEARKVIDGVRDDLCRRNFAEPMLCDSGNGYHLWYRIDLPADDGGFVEHTLKLMAKRHNTAGATVDTTTFNASRVMKIPGTWARKGDSMPNRPHRMARVLEVPSNIEISNV